MHIESLSIRNFRCFGDSGTKIDFRPGITGFVGDNGTGKTTVLDALKRLFAVESIERRLQLTDVHFGPNEDSQNLSDREVVIDVIFNISNKETIPHVFTDIFFNEGDDSLKVRLILEGHYKKSESNTDDIDTILYTVKTLDKIPFGPNDERKIRIKVRPTQYAELVYIPAHRDSLGVTHSALKNLLRRLELSADWDERTKNQSLNFAKELEEALSKVPAVNSIGIELKKFWGLLYDGYFDAEPFLSVVATDFEQMIRSLKLRFRKTPEGTQHQIEELSEGQISLLYFAVSATLQNLVWKLDGNSIEAEDNPKGFKLLEFVPPPLTILAFEEPENHLAPFYLPRMIDLINYLIKRGRTQSIITSHSTSILSRIKPRNVRYFRYDREKLISSIYEIPLDINNRDDIKFLNQVIRTNPEIYFSRLVIIGEGDSERIVIPRIAEAFGIPLDPSFVAFITIGGIHALHLWRLAFELRIPTLTILDFDLGRINGGIKRISNIVKWYKKIIDNDYFFDDGKIYKNEIIQTNELDISIKKLQKIGVFFSFPLDLDMMMLNAFPEVYEIEATYEPISDPTRKNNLNRLVFGQKGKGNSELKHIGKEFNEKELFYYNQLFNSRSKPVSHYKALEDLDDDTIRKKCPPPLRSMLKSVCNLLNVSIPEELED